MECCIKDAMDDSGQMYACHCFSGLNDCGSIELPEKYEFNASKAKNCIATMLLYNALVSLSTHCCLQCIEKTLLAKTSN